MSDSSIDYDALEAGLEAEAARLRRQNHLRHPPGDPDRDDCACCRDDCPHCNGGVE